MLQFFQLVGKEHTVQLFGIKLLGVSGDNGKKLLVTVAFLLSLWAANRLLRLFARALVGEKETRLKFWLRQAIRLATAMALVTAGLAVASQKVISAFAGYFIVLRGKNFNVGDRIVMGGVRGDVISLGFMQTTIMEMGQPPPEQGDAPSMWVAGRQYTGRIVTITNDKIFDEPVYNYSSEFPYIWEEMHIPIPYGGNREDAERIILDAVGRHTEDVSKLGEEALKELERRYMIQRTEMKTKVYFRLTDNWVEMAVRFVAETHSVRALKDAISRDILDGFDAAKIQIASGTYEVVGMPELKVRFNGEP